MATMLRVREITARLKIGRTKVYEDERAGLLPKWVRLGPKAVAMPDQEVEVVVAARIADRSDEEIKLLVRRMAAQRSENLAALTANLP